MRERILRVAGGKHEELRVEALERFLQLLAPGDLEDELDTGAELEILVAGADDARVAGRCRPTVRMGSEVAARIASTSPSASSASAPCASAACASAGPSHGNDERDPVALGDGMAQTSRAGHSRAL